MEFPSVIPPTKALTIKEKNLVYLIDLIKGLRSEVEGFETTPLFKTVGRGDPDDLPEVSVASAPAVYVEDGEENHNGDMTSSVVTKTLFAYVHIRFAQGQQGVDPYSVFNYYLGRLQSAILEDNRLGGNCFDVNEVSSQSQIFRQDRLLGGYLALNIRYRHVRNDPYTQR